MTNVVGRPVQGGDFFDREQEIARIWRHLDADNVLLLAPRRVGKTSLMHRLAEQAPQRGFVPAFVDAQDLTSEHAFVAEMYAAASSFAPFLQKLRDGPFGRFFSRIKKVGFAGVSLELEDAANHDWHELGEALISAIVESEGEQRALFLVDELPVFILELTRQDQTGARAQAFLHWLRAVRVGPTTSDRFRFLLAGSIGLDTVARRLRLSKTVNDLFVVNLGPFAEPVASRFLDELATAHQMPLSEPTKQRILERSGWLIPYHLQLFFSELHDLYRDESVEPSPAAVDSAYGRLLQRASYFDHWYDRLRDELGAPDDEHAGALLSAIARDPEGATLVTLQGILERKVQEPDRRDEQLAYLLNVLESDGYVVEQGGRRRFCSPLLRAFWLRRVAGVTLTEPAESGE